MRDRKQTINYRKLKNQVMEKSIEADPDNLDLYVPWANNNMELLQLQGIKEEVPGMIDMAGPTQ